MAVVPRSTGGASPPWGARAPAGAVAAILYMDIAGEWACRRCHGAIYEVTREDRKARLFRAARRTRAALGDFGEIGAPLPDRPPGMWTSTYSRRLARAIRAEDAALDAMQESATRFERRRTRVA